MVRFLTLDAYDPDRFSKPIKFLNPDNPNVIFLVFLVAFAAAGAMVMLFTKIPVFVAFMIVFIRVTLVSISLPGKAISYPIKFIPDIVFATLLNIYSNILERKNISDLLFIFLLIAAFIYGFYYYYPIYLMFLFLRMLNQEKEKKLIK